VLKKTHVIFTPPYIFKTTITKVSPQAMFAIKSALRAIETELFKVGLMQLLFSYSTLWS
jgi:hypothetical protein